MMNRGLRCMAFGIIPDVPSIFWDFDGPQESMLVIHEIVRELHLSENISTGYGRPFQVYRTKHGFHLIIRCKTWDEAQDWLEYLRRKTRAQSIMNCRKQRIRVSMKFLEKDGSEVSPAPVLVWGNWGSDLRTGRKEIYTTYDVGLNAGMTELPE